MTEIKVKHLIADLMQYVQLATKSEKNVFTGDYIKDVNNPHWRD
ncbi:hypothetical protein [Paucisalibacillus globulus]|nr:hypothetical protein [Paucisalibacillus globulus]